METEARHRCGKRSHAPEDIVRQLRACTLNAASLAGRADLGQPEPPGSNSASIALGNKIEKGVISRANAQIQAMCTLAAWPVAYARFSLIATEVPRGGLQERLLRDASRRPCTPTSMRRYFYLHHETRHLSCLYSTSSITKTKKGVGRSAGECEL